MEASVGGPNAWIDSYGILGLSKLRFYGESMREVMRRPIRGPSWGSISNAPDAGTRSTAASGCARVTLAGHLLQAKGDRVAMHSSVEVRYPFLDEDVFDFTARLIPRWKLRGFRDKHILRLLAERWLPPSVYKRQKVIFRAPLDSFHLDPEPQFVRQLLSEESLRGLDTSTPWQWLTGAETYKQMRPNSFPRLSVEMGLAAVVATQLLAPPVHRWTAR